MPILQLRNVSHAFGVDPVLDKASLVLDVGERVCLIGRNGEGKSTLLKIIEAKLQPDSGEVVLTQGKVIASLEQEVPQTAAGSIYDVVAQALGEAGDVLQRFHHASLSLDGSDAAMKQLGNIQQQMDALDAWSMDQRIQTAISRLQLQAELDFSSLSGGYKRRVLLARAMVLEPDILLLDEPTNHLDVAFIEWLEDWLKDFRGAVLFITHDRRFLANLATRIIELDRGQLTSWQGSYADYQRRKAEALEAEEKANALQDKKLAQEEAWIRQGIKARRTRNEGRVRALKALREERKQRRDRKGQAKIKIDRADSSAKMVLEVEDLSYSWDSKAIVRNFSTRIQRGDKIGIIGPNGVGKTTLLRLLLGQLQADSGTVQLGQRLEVAWFDQLRESLNESKSVQENVSPVNDEVVVGGKRKHIVGYLQDFLFSPKRIRSPVSSLSGGERNRLLLARLFLKPCNLLVLDEPTNDLDVETLEILEELLVQFDGTLFVVSHDREFLDNIVTSCIVFEGDNQVNEYVGGYSDWLRQKPAEAKANTNTRKAEAKPDKKTATKKLGYKQQRELDALPKMIEALEEQIESMQTAMTEAGFYQQEQSAISKFTDEMKLKETELETAYQRWEELEDS